MTKRAPARLALALRIGLATTLRRRLNPQPRRRPEPEWARVSACCVRRTMDASVESG